MKSEIIRKTLPNGLRITHIKNKMNNVNVTVSVKVGSENETPENNGVSHFLEHMLWHGTPNLTEEKIRTELKDKKANYNANTSFKKTSYYIGSPKRHFERLVQILAEIIQNPDFDEKKIETEKNIILDEYKHHKDNPNYFISELLVNKLFKDHPISKPIIGTQENIEHMNKEMLLKHHSDYYVPNNTVITIVGNLKDPEQVIEKYFTFQPKEVPVLNLVEPIFNEQKTIQTGKNTKATYIALGFPGVCKTHKDRSIFEAINYTLNLGKDINLLEAIRHKMALTYSISTSNNNFQEAGFLAISTSTNKEKVDETIDLILLELKKLENIKAKELDLAKKFLLKSHKVYNQIPFLLEQVVIENELYGYWGEYEDTVNKIKAITVEDVRRVAKQYFNKIHTTIILEQENLESSN